MKRRDVLKVGTVAGAALLLPAQRLVASATGAPVTVQAFTAPLRIPPVLRPVMQTADTDIYDIVQHETAVEIVPGTRTVVMTYSGSFPGPTIQARSGRRVRIRQINALNRPTSVHLHGAHVGPESDGHPTDVIQPGSFKTYTYPNQQPATTLWYHDHAHHVEAENVFRGLAGFYLIGDGNPYNLPSGQYDVALMFRDIHLDDNAQVVYLGNDLDGRNIVLTNGVPQPYFRVAARKYRFRLLNGSNDRAFRFALSNGANFVQVGSDGGYLPARFTTPVLDLWPAERADVVVDFSGLPVGTHVVLTNGFGETDATRNVVRFEIDRTAADTSRIPTDAELPDLPPLGSATVTRDLALAFDPGTGQFLINGKGFDPNRVDFTVKKDQLEIWNLRNTDPFGIPHNFHVHLAQFRVLDRNGAAPAPGETGWKDTVTIMDGHHVRVAVRFSGYTGRYVFHCHLIDHATIAMMGQLEVVP